VKKKRKQKITFQKKSDQKITFKKNPIVNKNNERRNKYKSVNDSMDRRINE